MKKRAVSFALALVLCLGLVPTAAMAAGTPQPIPCKYDKVTDFSGGHASVALDTGEKDKNNSTIYRWGVIDATGKELTPLKYAEVGEFSDGMAAVKVDTGEKDKYGDPVYKWGFIDAAGQEVIPCRYDKARPFSEGYAPVAVGIGWNQHWGFVDQTGKEIIQCQYEDARPFSGGVALVKSNDMWGLTDIAGQTTALGAYTAVEDKFQDGVMLVSKYSGKDNQYGGRIDQYFVIDATGKRLTQKTYMKGTGFINGMAAVAVDSGKHDSSYLPIPAWGFVDKTGAETVPCVYAEVHPFTEEGLAAVKKEVGENGAGYPVYQWGFVNKQGQEVIPCKYTRVEDFSEGLAAVEWNTGEPGGRGPDDIKYLWGFLDATGKEVIPFRYEAVGDGGFHDGVAAVIENGAGRYFGNHFIDKAGNRVCSGWSEEPFSEGLALIRRSASTSESGSFYGFVDKTGKYVIPCCFEAARSFSEGLAAVKLDGKWGFISADPNDSRNLFNATAYPSTQIVNVDGKDVEFHCYALKDANGNLTNYIGIRDLAMALKGTKKQCNVKWESSIVAIYLEMEYEPTGTEGTTPFTGEQPCRRDSAYFNRKHPCWVTSPGTGETFVASWIDDSMEYLGDLLLTDENGGGYTYYPLRKLGEYLDFNVGWSAEKGIYIETDKPYDESN